MLTFQLKVQISTIPVTVMATPYQTGPSKSRPALSAIYTIIKAWLHVKNNNEKLYINACSSRQTSFLCATTSMSWYSC